MYFCLPLDLISHILLGAGDFDTYCSSESESHPWQSSSTEQITHQVTSFQSIPEVPSYLLAASSKPCLPLGFFLLILFWFISFLVFNSTSLVTKAKLNPSSTWIKYHLSCSMLCVYFHTSSTQLQSSKCITHTNTFMLNIQNVMATDINYKWRWYSMNLFVSF